MKFNLSPEHNAHPFVTDQDERTFVAQLLSVAVGAGPEMGPLMGLMIGPEQGGWQVDEITVSSSRTNHVDRYVAVVTANHRILLP